ncbi:hypothetical protein YPPY47_2045, partial [Yersinia pestis PY-47]
MRRLRQR